jgi:hypothetical protein
MSDTVVYLGPTLRRVVAEKVLTAEYLPSICRGDLARLREEVRFVGIVDGEFYQRLAVSQRNYLRAEQEYRRRLDLPDLIHQERKASLLLLMVRLLKKARPACCRGEGDKPVGAKALSGLGTGLKE